MSVLDAPQLISRPHGKINLNAGTLSPTPLVVLERVEALRRLLASDPSDFCWRKTPPLIQAARTSLAAYLNVRPDHLLLVQNVTVALNIVVSSLTLPRGTEILLMDHEYGAMNFLWQRWAAVRDWNLRTVHVPWGRDTTPSEIVAGAASQISSASRVLFLYHVTSPTGIVMPVKELCALARQREILTVVDGAHAPGMVPCDLSAINADFYGANTHKWLMGPAVGGFLAVARHRRQDLRPLVTSWGWNYPRSEAFDDSGNGGSRWQWDLEFHGTLDKIPLAVLPETLAFRESLGGDAAIAKRTRELADYSRKVIPLPCRTPLDPALSAALTVFETPPCTPNDIRDELYHNHGIECPVTVAGGRQFLRVSNAIFNTEDDLDRLGAAVKTIFPAARANAN